MPGDTGEATMQTEVQQAQDLNAIEVSTKQAREAIEMYDALDRLTKNDDFQKLIEKGYLEDNAVRLVWLRGDAALQTEEHQAAILKEIDGVAQLRSFFIDVTRAGHQALRTIEQNDITREEILAEDVIDV